MRSATLPVSCIEDVAVDFLSHLPSFEFYGFHSLERGQLEIKTKYTGLFISPSGISERDCATTKTDTAERSISIRRESLQVFFLY